MRRRLFPRSSAQLDRNADEKRFVLHFHPVDRPMGRHRLCGSDAEQSAREAGFNDRRLLLSDAEGAAETGMAGTDRAENRQRGGHPARESMRPLHRAESLKHNTLVFHDITKRLLMDGGLGYH